MSQSLWGHQLGRDVKIQHVQVSDGVSFPLAAGTTEVNSGIVDMAGYRGLLWIVILGVMAASSTVDVKAQQGQASNMADAADLLGSASAQADANDDDKYIALDIVGPAERYQRLAFTRGNGGNSEILACIAILYDPVNKPVVQDVASAGQAKAVLEFFQRPAEGTA
jgi:hypothetical protein